MKKVKDKTNFKKLNNAYIKSGAGFTLIEILIVIFLIAFLSSVLFIGRSAGEKKLALDRTTYQLSQDLREIQGMAMGAKEFDCGGGVITHSFGIHFKSSWIDYYIMFADCNADQVYDQDDDRLLRPKVRLEKEVGIIDLSPSSSFSVVFKPPDPKVYINEESWNKEAEITLSLDSAVKKVKINSAGRIEIE